MHVHRVLVVDDDSAIRESVGDVIRDEGWEAVYARNGDEALEILRADAPPCLIVLDLTMPILTGWDFLVRRRAEPELFRIPVVVFTAGKQDVLQLPDASNVKAVLYKSRPVDFVSIVGRFCSRSPSSAAIA